MTRGRPRWGLAATWIALLAMAGAEAADWREDARRFTGESAAVRARAIERLRRDPELRARLQAALETRDRPLAYDVITALRMRELLPALLRTAERDASGFGYHAINSILDPADAPEALRIYRERLDSARTSLASRIALLDSLARTTRPLPAAKLREFLRDDAPELRASALAYVRKRLRERKESEFLPAARAALDDAQFPVRVQAQYLARELVAEAAADPGPPAWGAGVAELAAEAASRCRADPRLAREEICGNGEASGAAQE